MLVVLLSARVATAWFAWIARVARLAGLVAARVGDYIQDFNRSDRIVTGDDQLATLRVTAAFVLDDDAETGTRSQGGRERIVDEPKVTAFAGEGDLCDVQVAIAHVAD